MICTSFDACIDCVLHKQQEKSVKATLTFGEKRISALIHSYDEGGSTRRESLFIAVALSLPHDLRWGDPFAVVRQDGTGNPGRARVLMPGAEKPGRGKKEAEKRIDLLRRLSGDESEMLDAFALEKGVKGLSEKEILDLTPLSGRHLIELSQKLEAEAQIRIMSFSPLVLLAQSGFEYLCEKILAFLKRYHETHGNEWGVSAELAKRKFDLPSRIYSLALGHLLREEKIVEKDGRLALPGHRRALTAEEEALLLEMETMYLDGELFSVSMEELQRRFRLPVKRLENLLSFLMERKRIVKGKDGFILHSKWLEELAGRIRNSGKSELSVGEFKEMTGLSRKYAIPLLELLDQMGVTRRRGPIREIQK